MIVFEFIRIQIAARLHYITALKLTTIRQEKNTKSSFWGPETARRGGASSTREGIGVEKFVPSLESLFCLGSREGTWDVPGILPGCPGPLGAFKKFVQKQLCASVVPCTKCLK